MLFLGFFYLARPLGRQSLLYFGWSRLWDWRGLHSLMMNWLRWSANLSVDSSIVQRAAASFRRVGGGSAPELDWRQGTRPRLVHLLNST